MAKDLTLQLYLFTLGYYVEHIGNLFMIYKLHKQKSMYGISIDTQICMLVATLARLFWMWDTQLVRLNISVLEILLAIAFHVYIVFQCYQLKDSIYKGISLVFLKSPFLIAICFIFCMIFHPGTKGEFFFTLQMFVSFTIFLEGLALLPQLYHLRTSKDPEGLTSTYLYLLGASRLVRVFFWIAMITNNDTFWYLIAADVLHNVLLIAFFFFFRKTTKSKEDILGYSDKSKFKDF
jgi:ER lumen protein retaining receptor